MEPTERSIPAVMMTRVIPRAMMLITAVWRTTLARLVSVKSAVKRSLRL